MRYFLKSFFHLGLAVIINRINKPNITVGVDGSLYRFHPRFKRNMEKCMRNSVNKNIKVRPRSISLDHEITSDFSLVQIGSV